VPVLQERMRLEGREIGFHGETVVHLARRNKPDAVRWINCQNRLKVVSKVTEGGPGNGRHKVRDIPSIDRGEEAQSRVDI
jgi:hypothetical protein